MVWQHKGSPPDLQMDTMATVWDQWERSDYDGVIERLADQHARVDTHIKTLAAAARQARIQAAVKRRSDNFADPSGKGKGEVLASVFKGAREGTELTHVRREDGTLACSEQEVSSVLHEFFTQ